MVTRPLTLEHWHAIDAPFEDFDDWADNLTPGLCTACTRDTWHGNQRWWHTSGARLCPDRHKRTPGFSPDVQGEP